MLPNVHGCSQKDVTPYGDLLWFEPGMKQCYFSTNSQTQVLLCSGMKGERREKEGRGEEGEHLWLKLTSAFPNLNQNDDIITASEVDDIH